MQPAASVSSRTCFSAVVELTASIVVHNGILCTFARVVRLSSTSSLFFVAIFLNSLHGFVAIVSFRFFAFYIAICCFLTSLCADQQSGHSLREVVKEGNCGGHALPTPVTHLCVQPCPSYSACELSFRRRGKLCQPATMPRGGDAFFNSLLLISNPVFL